MLQQTTDKQKINLSTVRGNKTPKKQHKTKKKQKKKSMQLKKRGNRKCYMLLLIREFLTQANICVNKVIITEKKAS